MTAIAMALLAASTTAQDQVEMRWQASAIVHAGPRDIAIEARTTLSDRGVLSESWPVAEGEKRGLRRMIIDGQAGWLERGGERTPMPEDMLSEERQQFGFYRELQDAASWCGNAGPSGSTTRTFGRTSFRCTGGRVTRAANWIGTARQDFRIAGLLRSNGMVFPKRLSIRRDGQPYFDMTVERFDAVQPAQ